MTTRAQSGLLRRCRGLGVGLLLIASTAIPALGAEPEGSSSDTDAASLVDVGALLTQRPAVEPEFESAAATAVPRANGPVAEVPGMSPGIASTDGWFAWNDILPDCSTRPCTEPANTGIAVSPSFIVEWSDQGISFHDRSAGYLGTVSRESFFAEGPTQGRGGSVSVVWDPLHSRWLATEATDDCSAGRVYLAISAGADPTGTWKVYGWTYAGGRPMRPTIGTTSDKILLASDHGSLAGCAVYANSGGRVIVADTATALTLPAVLPTSTLDLGQDTLLALRPAVSRTATTTAYLVDLFQANPNFSIDVGYATIVGTVAGGNVQFSNSIDLTTVGLAAVTSAENVAPWGDGTALGTAPVQAVWSSGRLWFALTRGCSTACVRVVEIDTTTAASPVVSQQIDIGDGAMPAFAPGIALAGNGELWVAYARAAGNGVIEPVAAYRESGDAPNTIRPSARLMPGTGSYAGARWGPSAGIATDPADADAVWQHNATSGVAGGWFSLASRLEGGQSGAPGGTALVNGGASSTVYMRVLLALARATGSGVTEVRISDSGTMSPARVMPAYDLISWQLDDQGAGGSKATGTRGVYVQFGDGAGNWSPTVSDTIFLSSSVPLTRLSGADRYATAAAISKATFAPGVPYAFIASGLNFPDALAGASAAGWNGSPILFVGSTLPQATITELERLQPEEIVILGGTTVVSSSIATSLAAYATSHTVTRLAGSDRFATAAEISEWTYPNGAPFAFVAYGFNFPDALAAGPVAGLYGAPILFVTTTAIPAATAAELDRLDPEFIVVVGGPGVISTAVEDALDQYAGDGGVGRLAGSDRYATAATIVDWAFLPQVDGAFIASGLNYPDALAGAAAAATKGCPILFVGATVPPPTAYELDYQAPKQYWILGGTSVVSSSVANQLLPYLGP